MTWSRDQGSKSFEQRDAEEMRCKLLSYPYPLLHPLTILGRTKPYSATTSEKHPLAALLDKSKKQQHSLTAPSCSCPREQSISLSLSRSNYTDYPVQLLRSPFLPPFNSATRIRMPPFSTLQHFVTAIHPTPNTPFVRPIFSRLAKSAFPRRST